MSPNMTSHKLTPIITSYFWPAILALFMAVFLSQWAVADPPAKTDSQTTETIKEVPPESANDAIELPAEDKSVIDKEATPDAMPYQTTPAVDKKSIGAKLSEKCYEQTDGSYECVCEGEKECKILETAEHCQAGTHWGKDGYGGCTKKAAE